MPKITARCEKTWEKFSNTSPLDPACLASNFNYFAQLSILNTRIALCPGKDAIALLPP
ncbi:MAG: hypothetical protein ABI180_05305 [Microcoleus sp.]